MSKSQAWTLENLERYIPDDLRKLLDFEEVGEVLKVSMKEFMHGPKGKETWGIINKLLKQAGGAWVSEGKMSHWAVPKFQEDTQAHARIQKVLEDIVAAAQTILHEIQEGKI